MERLVNLFSDFDFEAEEMYLAASQDADATVHSTYLFQMQFSGMNHQRPWCPEDSPRNFRPENTVYENMLLFAYFNVFN